MTIEEKAKRYDEILAMAKECITYIPDESVNKYMLNMFPELAEPDDERIRKALIDFFNRGAENGEQTNGVCDKDILAWLERQGQTFTQKDVDDAYLKGICDAKQELEKQGEQKPAWTEEDNVFCDGIISHFEKELGDITVESECSDKQVISDLKYCYKRNINWLKSLKERYTWKPSDEQMASIACAVRKMKESACYDSELVSLFNDLKKLREE